MKKWNKPLAAVFFLSLLLMFMTAAPAGAAQKAGLSQTKVTVAVGQSKTVKLKNTSKKATWKVVSGKKNISVTKGKNRVKIKGLKAGKSKIVATAGNKKFTCRITVKKKKSPSSASGAKIAVKSDKYTIIFQLNDSQAAKDLYSQLPLTAEAEDFSDNEKIFYPPKKLSVGGTPKSQGKKGSLAYYAPWGDVVMFYEAAEPASGLYELGNVVSGGGNISKLSGEITITRED